MDERGVQPGATERPISGGDEPSSGAGPAHLGDPRPLTILTTEHWSLLTARSLVYNEAFASSLSRCRTAADGAGRPVRRVQRYRHRSPQPPRR
jgi:hypothetical protein